MLVVLHHSHPCCLNQAEIFKQHRELSMYNNEEAGIKPSKTYQSFVAAAGGHRELSFIRKDVRNYITREMQNVSELEDAKEFGKYLLRMKEKNPNFFFELELEVAQSIKIAFWVDARNRTACEYFKDVISFDTTYNINKYNLVFGSFVGVNYHGQSTLLGCILIKKNEDVQSFKLLFKCRLRYMGGNILKEFLPINEYRCKVLLRLVCSVAHNYSLMVPSKLNGYKRHEKIVLEMSHVVWKSLTKEAFNSSVTRTASDFRVMVSSRGVKIALRRSSFMDSNLSGSPLMGRDEKHTKEREHALF
ncbi:hypothetical protein Ahy_B01g056269 isoform A [Arachis hypogaea]|uniref:MULE transposase domain-containing protein n=1 Tax=Arachis hypogaea TaxID=3818 RepID=A0A445AYI8_ARAHY|nr:hypothetical protein Ahy_B01g056269 isoform A [Arachis hypogaea]